MSDIQFDDLEGDLNEGDGKADKRNTVEWSNPCPHCRGTGRFKSYTGRTVGDCFKCKGTGTLTFKTAPKKRAKARASQQASKERKVENAKEIFAAQHPTQWAWIVENRESFPFAASLYSGIEKFGILTQGQFDAIDRSIAKRAVRAVERAEKADLGKAVDVSRIEEIFENARNAALKKPKLRVGEITLHLAGEFSSNPGAIYVGRGEVYLGKIMGGTYQPSRDATAEDIHLVEETARNPLELAIAYGKRTGNCSCCGRALSDPELVAAGIGPICATKWGL